MALDHGSRRIGVAVADDQIGMPFARPAIRRRGGAGDLDAVLALVSAEQADLVVLGLPLNADGSEGPQAAVVRRFGKQLSEAGLEVAYADERLTSWQAERELAERGRRADRASGELDSLAARLILQEYLAARITPTTTDPSREEPE